MRLRLLLGLSTVLALSVGVSAALAAPPAAGSCSGGSIASGTYRGFTVTGTCTIDDGATVTIDGDLNVVDGAVLNDHAASTATVHVTGNVRVGRGAVLGLGGYGPPGIKTDTTVDGNIVALQPLSLYLSGITVHGNVTSIGGGSGPSGEFRNFPTKDDSIDGNLVVLGWHGGWLGVIRDHVGGNVIVMGNASVVIESPPGCDPEAGGCTGSEPGTDLDSTEVQTNVVGGNLICLFNHPRAQVNPADGGQPNVVAGHEIGECAGL